MIPKGIKKEGLLLQSLKHLAIVGFSFVIVWCYALIALNISFFNPISEAIKSFSITDIYYQMMSEKESRLIVLVDMTHLYDRGAIAQTINEIESCKPAVIGVDCIFEGEKEDTMADNAVRDVAKRYNNIVFSYRLLDEQADGSGYSRSIHSFFAKEIEVHEGITNIQRDNIYNGMKRKLRAGWMQEGAKKPTLVGEIVNLYAKENVIKVSDDEVKINFAPTHFNVIDPSEITQNKELIEGRIVLFGTLTDETDMHYTPLGKMAGVQLLAYATHTLLESSQITEVPIWLQGIIAVMLVVLTNILQLAYIGWTLRSKNPFIHYVIGSGYVLGLVTFLWIALIMWISFLCFNLYNLSVETGWSIAAMAFLSTSRSFYAACEAYYKLWKERLKKTS